VAFSSDLKGGCRGIKMAKECFFFMTKEDLLTIFQEIEKYTLLKYVYGGIYV